MYKDPQDFVHWFLVRLVFNRLDFWTVRIFSKIFTEQRFWIQIFQDFPRLGQDFHEKAAKTVIRFLRKVLADEKAWPIGVGISVNTRQNTLLILYNENILPKTGKLKKGRNRPEVVC